MSISAPVAQDWAGRMALAPHVALDEAVLAYIRSRQPKNPPQDAADRNVAELATAAALFENQGWLADPRSYHQVPTPLRDSDFTSHGSTAVPHRHETVTFASGFRPRETEPGAQRWSATEGNDTVVVRLLRHPGRRAPWVVCLHGFGMGTSRFDVSLLWGTYLHKQLGLNVAVPVLPFHGPRRMPGDDQLLSMDLALTLHSISQAIWDVRRLVGWIRESSGAPVGVYGLSLGGFLASLLAGIEPLDCVVAGIPFVDVPNLMAHHNPPPAYLDALRSPAARDVFTVVSPLSVKPLLPLDRRAILAARGDRLIPGDQPQALQASWQLCRLDWCNGGHVGFVWSRRSRGLVTDRFREALLPGDH